MNLLDKGSVMVGVVFGWSLGVLMTLAVLCSGCSSDMVGLTRAMNPMNAFQSHPDDKTDSAHTTYGKIPSPKDKCHP